MSERRTIVCVGVAIVLAAYWMANAGSLEPPGPPAPTMKTLDRIEARQPLDSAGPQTILASGSYYLTGDLSSAGPGIAIAADDVTLDLNGFTLTGSATGDGVEIVGRQNVVVRNGRIRSFGRGVFVSGSTGVALDGLRIVESATTGVFVTDLSSEVEVRACSVSKNGDHGIYVYSGNDAVSALLPHYIRHNTVDDNGSIGILASGVLTFIDHNVVTNNDSHGIDLSRGDHSVTSNRVGYNFGSGVRIGADFVHVIDNSSVGNSGFGFEDASDAGVLIARNLAQFNYYGDYTLTASSNGLTSDVGNDPNGWQSVNR